MNNITLPRAVVEQALELWENGSGIALGSLLESILEQPQGEQEPVAATLAFYEDQREPRLLSWNRLPNGEHWLYTHPQPRQPLTDEQIQGAATKAVQARKLSWLGFRKDSQGHYTIPDLSLCHYQLARAIERAHGIGGN